MDIAADIGNLAVNEPVLFNVSTGYIAASVHLLAAMGRLPCAEPEMETAGLSVAASNQGVDDTERSAAVAAIDVRSAGSCVMPAE